MRYHDSDDYRDARKLRLLHTGPSLSRTEARAIFREMVRAEARNGRLSPLRRKRLIQYAAALQLTPLDASRIVTEVCCEIGAHDPGDVPGLYRLVETAAQPRRWPMGVQLTLVVIGALAAQQLIVALWRG